MEAEIITIGDELLIGQVVDTNSAWIGKELNAIGIKVARITSLPDVLDEIVEGIRAAASRCRIVFVTGGLGPTSDDVTKPAFMKLLNCGLVPNAEVLKDIQTLFAKRNFPLTERNIRQADVPEKAFVLRNHNGTAPGMRFSILHAQVFSLPGVPYEMKALVSEQIIPYLKDTFSLPFILHRTLLTQGVGESMIAEKLQEFERNLHPNIKLAYLPSPGSVRLRLSYFGPVEDATGMVDAAVQKIREALGSLIYGEGEQSIESVALDLLVKQKRHLAIAESCTGGAVCSTLVKVPGASLALRAGLVVYTPEMKTRFLGIPHEFLKKEGVVSEATALAMVRAAMERCEADAGIATTGVAGPGPDSDGNPAGLIYIAAAVGDQVRCKQLMLGDNRERFIQVATQSAFMLLRKLLLDENESR